eukprot:TRINITY_DN6068_c0_g1_i2.p1 TRINITY_DN6068_c0_g1~~TRINITY_DN6068_c0_g1_i2.p1  ORF type:complete len:256 (+),score=112.45 TRINITY_DN6068_c0_g1_i2:158-925(+)
MKFSLVLCLSTTAMAMPANETWTAWAQSQSADIVEPLYEVRDQVAQGWEWLQEFLPGNVTKYVDETLDEGQEVFADIFEETRKDIVEKTSGNVDDITGLVEGFIQKLTSIKDSSVNIVTQEEPLSVQQIEARNVQENLEGTKQKLKQLKAEVSEDKNEDKNLEGIEGMIQRLITSAREVLTEVNGQTDLFWSKVKQMEVEVYRVNSIMAETSGDLKDVLKDLFTTLNKELREASPQLKEILDKVDKEAGKAPRLS